MRILACVLESVFGVAATGTGYWHVSLRCGKKNPSLLLALSINWLKHPTSQLPVDQQPDRIQGFPEAA